MRTYLQEDCVKMLRRCLDLGKETLLRSGKRGACQLLLLRLELLSPETSSLSREQLEDLHCLASKDKTAPEFPNST